MSTDLSAGFAPARSSRTYTKQSFLKLLRELEYKQHPHAAFSDFVTMSAISMHNAVAFNQELEDQYLSIASGYNRDELNIHCQLLANLVELLEVSPRDVLGELYMELEIANKKTGQFFTPYEVCLMMAKLSCGEGLDETLQERGFITLTEPACGSGSMVIAFAEVMREHHYNPQKQLWVQCIDVDPVPAYMCYLQLALLHIPGEVVIGNTLTMQFQRVLRTPAHYLGLWQFKRAQPLSEPAAQLSVNTPAPTPSTCADPQPQLALAFDVEL